jgi:two-component system, NtrC family, sensor kinase
MPSGGESGARAKPSLRAELLFNLAFLAAGALLLAVATALIAPLLGDTTLGVVLVVVLVAADVAIFILFGRYLVSRLVTGPIDALVAVTDAVARGRLEQRAPETATRELATLADSVNRMTERLLDAQGALVRAEKLASVGRLAAGVAHEVGNPLAAATNYAEVLRRRGADAEVLAALGRELGRIDAIVKSMLEYARPRAAAPREPLDLGVLAREALRLLEAQGVLRGRTLHTAGLAAAPVLGEKTALEQVCVNLLLNAAHAAGESGTISVAAGPAAEAPVARRSSDGAVFGGERRSGELPRYLERGGRAVQLVVGDSGPGVRAEDAARIFDPFVTTKEPGKGTGLGLAIVQRIVHDHGGRVDVRQAREGGAAFVVTLPERA